METVMNEIPHALNGFEARFNEPLSSHTSFNIGGMADFWIEPRSIEELKRLLEISNDIGQVLYLIGGGNNILVEDEGLRGIAIHLGDPFFRRIECLGEDQIRVGSGADLSQLLSWTAEEGLSGLEFLAGIPGTLGGAIWMNAGRGIKVTEGRKRNDRESVIPHHIGDLVESVTLMRENGKIQIVGKEEIEFGYRETHLPNGIILEAVLQLCKGDPSAIREQIRENLKTKIKTQDLYFPSAGCVFKNPLGGKRFSGELIEQVGLKGVRIGGAQVSERHANFIINRGSAKSEDVLRLIRLVQHRVKEEHGIGLELELKVFRSHRRAHGGVVQ